MNITLNIIKNKQALYEQACKIIVQQVANGAKTFGLATGGTMEPLYEQLRESTVDFSECISFNLDEYVGLQRTHEQTYYTYMQQQLFHAKPFKASYLPNGETANSDVEAANYEQMLQNATLHFQLLGLGVNGHIGFNEPGTPFDALTHVVDLTASTREANARFFDSIDDVPTQAITMGIASILRAQTILLVVVGESKRAALQALMSGEMTTDIPVTALQQHPHVIVLTDIEL